MYTYVDRELVSHRLCLLFGGSCSCRKVQFGACFYFEGEFSSKNEVGGATTSDEILRSEIGLHPGFVLQLGRL
jgi:hypothetical protein